MVNETDSQAVQITADVAVGGSRSINAMNALVGNDASGADADLVNIAQGAAIFNGFAGAARPTLQTDIMPDPPPPLPDLANAIGSFRSGGQAGTVSGVDLSSFYPTATGSSVVADSFGALTDALATALLLLNAGATGAFQSTDYLATQAQAIRAYNFSNDL
jgi:hypothetical protein